jgi:hypothetical protein
LLQVVLGHAAEFLQANTASLELNKASPKYAFKWLHLADAACLTDACKAIVDRIIEVNRSTCKAEALEGLSRQILMHIAERSTADSGPGKFKAGCGYCGCIREFKVSCTYCGRVKC